MDLLEEKRKIIEKIARMEMPMLIFDVDGTIYPQDSAYGKSLYETIANTWNQTVKDHPHVAKKYAEILQDKGIEDPGKVTAENLKPVYSAMIATYIALEKEAFDPLDQKAIQELIADMFGDNYHLIEEDTSLAAEFHFIGQAMRENMRYGFNTNSPSSNAGQVGIDYPVQRIILQRFGIYGREIANHSKHNTFGLLESEDAGRDKTDPLHYTEDMCPALDTTPENSVMHDDKWEHATAAAKAGLVSIWKVESIAELSEEDVETALQQGVLPVDDLSEFVREVTDARLDYLASQ